MQTCCGLHCGFQGELQLPYTEETRAVLREEIYLYIAPYIRLSLAHAVFPGLSFSFSLPV